MTNKDLLPGIDMAMKGCTKVYGDWRYIPIAKLPIGTELIFKTQGGSPYLADPSRLINEKPEEHVVRLSDGLYGLRIGKWPHSTLTHPEGHTEDVKCFHRLLAPTSYFQANADRPNPDKKWWLGDETITYRLTTGEIKSIIIPETPYKTEFLGQLYSTGNRSEISYKEE